MRKLIPNEDLVKIAGSLEDYHKVFYTFWQMSCAMYTNELPTAAVEFVRDAPPALLINKAFWDSLSFRVQQFVIIHECLHVILDHFKRNAKGVKGATHRLVNVAQDITINEMIVSIFGFEREEIENWQRYCWIDTCFETPSAVLHNQSFLYYLHLLIAEAKPTGESKSDGLYTIDEHGGESGDSAPGDGASAEEDEERDKIAGRLAKEMDPGDLADMMNAGGANDEESKAAGNGAGMFSTILSQQGQTPKLNFRKLMEGLKKTRLNRNQQYQETFRNENRRFSTVTTAANGLVLPGKIKKKNPKKDKLFIAVFMDVSGSCMSQISKFHSIISAFKEEEEIFDCEFHLFDDNVANITGSKKPVAVGGGTSFSIIEMELQTMFKLKYGVYPDAVIVITDGFGNRVSPQYPNRWVWLLTNGNTDKYIHRASRKFLIRDVVFEK